MSQQKLLISGATGYIGGSILTALLGSSKPAFKNLAISVLCRKQEQADQLKTLGVTPILIRDLDDAETIRRAASEHDFVINAASGYHVGAAKSLALGLGDRKKATGKDVHMIHTSGTSNLSDYPITHKYPEDNSQRIFSDASDDLYTYEKTRDAAEPYAQRTADVVLIDTATAHGVNSYIIMSPTIYGLGTGLFNKLSIQYPTLIRASLAQGQAVVVGRGNALWNQVHIADLVELYLAMLERLVRGDRIPSNEDGYYFSETAENSWLTISELVATAGKALGAFQTEEVKSLDLQEGVTVLGMDERLVELALASNARTRSERSRALFPDWKPKKTFEDLKAGIFDEVKLIYEAK